MDPKQSLNQAKQGNLNSQFMLGQCYERGIGVLSDLEQAFYWYDLAAKQGDEDASQRLAALQLAFSQNTANLPSNSFFAAELNTKTLEQDNHNQQEPLAVSTEQTAWLSSSCLIL